jgi:type II secretory pathway pseudopilin PulG
MNRFRLTSRHARAFTLVEAVMSILIVSSVLVASLGTFGAIGQARQKQIDREAAVHLASQLMSEIFQCYYKEPTGSSTTLGPDAGETSLAAYDDVDDYDGFTASPPMSRDGTFLAGYTGWTRSVRVEYASLTDPSTASITDTGLKRIRVTVTAPGGMSYTMLAMRSSNGLYEQMPAASTNYLTWGGVSAQIGNKGKTIYGGAHPLNVTTSQ